MEICLRHSFSECSARDSKYCISILKYWHFGRRFFVPSGHVQSVVWVLFLSLSWQITWPWWPPEYFLKACNGRLWPLCFMLPCNLGTESSLQIPPGLSSSWAPAPRRDWPLAVSVILSSCAMWGLTSSTSYAGPSLSLAPLPLNNTELELDQKSSSHCALDYVDHNQNLCSAGGKCSPPPGRVFSDPKRVAFCVFLWFVLVLRGNVPWAPYLINCHYRDVSPNLCARWPVPINVFKKICVFSRNWVFFWRCVDLIHRFLTTKMWRNSFLFLVSGGGESFRPLGNCHPSPIFAVLSIQGLVTYLCTRRPRGRWL